MAEFRDPTPINPNKDYQITELADFIRTKMDGHDVREALALGLERAYEDAATSGNANMEVAQARGSYPTLARRLLELDETDKQTTAQLAQKANVLDTRENTNTKPINVSEMDTETKSLFTGGSVGVVGEKSVGSENLKESAVGAINTKDDIAVRTLLKASSTRRVPHNLKDNTTLLPEESVSTNLLRSSSTIKAGEFYTFVLKTNITDPSTVNFRLNVRNASNTILKTINFEYLGQGVFGILDFQSADEARLQFIFQNLTTTERTITTFIISEGGYPLGDFVLDTTSLPEFTGLNSLLNTSEKNIASGSVFYNDGSTTVTLPTKLTETIDLPTNHYVHANYGNSMEKGNNYTFIAKTDTEDPNFSKMFRLQKRLDGTIIETVDSKNVGNGLFIIPDVEYESGHEYRVIVWNELDDTVNLKTVLAGKNGIPTVNQEQTTNLQPYVYPLYPVWGHEYLYSWYEKIVNDDPLKMIWAGDSTTLNSEVPTNLTRSELGKLIMTKGGYPETDVTSINAGHGTQHTGNWLGGEYDEDKRTENGFLDEDMAQNPDLYVFGYSHNDGSDGHFGELTWEERVSRFETNLNIGLERIRGSMYNKSPDDMAIILCMPNSANGAGGHTHEKWYDRIRPIIQKAARDYKCGFVDITARQYDHSFSSNWSTNADNTHPTGIANLDYMSLFSDLLFPYLMHK